MQATEVVLQSTPEITNASSNLANGMGNASGLIGLLVVIVTLAVVVVVAVSAAERYERLLEAFAWVGDVLTHAMLGAITVGVVGVLGYTGYRVGETASANPRLTVAAVLAVAVGVPVLAGIGYLTRHALHAINDHHEAATGEPLWSPPPESEQLGEANQ